MGIVDAVPTLPNQPQLGYKIMLSVDGIVKICSTCREEKEVNAFGKDSNRKDGLSHLCKVCHRARGTKYRQSNPDKVAAYMKKWYETNTEKAVAWSKKYKQDNQDKVAAGNKKHYEANTEKIAARKKKYHEANREKEAVRSKKWQQNNPGKASAICAKRRAQKLLAYQPLTDNKMILLFFEERDRLNSLGGDTWHVDHIHPLQGKLICGFHHQDNLQLLTSTENHEKGNKFDPIGVRFTAEHPRGIEYPLPKVKFGLVEGDEYGYFL